MKHKKYILTSILTLLFLLSAHLIDLLPIGIIFAPLIWGGIYTVINKRFE